MLSTHIEAVKRIWGSSSIKWGTKMRLTLCLAALAASVATASPALAQSATAAGEARGTILQSLTLTKTADLDFGTVAPDVNDPGSVSVNANTGVRSTSGGVVALPGPFGRARFEGYGEAGQLVQLTLNQPAGGVLTNGGNSITAVLNLDASGATMRTIGVAGNFVVHVGGDFGIGANQPNGLYAAQFDLTADYQ
ncbi:MAG TPA: DUF4402 domain-containing protein [Sphingomicrobium sp.]|jgi:hypothetical protein|nr:DUF4402 domain-containing protein [Sphingomicrobium sp.]